MARLSTVFIENEQKCELHSGNAASIGGNPGPQVCTLFSHWACDGWTCRYTRKAQGYLGLKLRIHDKQIQVGVWTRFLDLGCMTRLKLSHHWLRLVSHWFAAISPTVMSSIFPSWQLTQPQRGQSKCFLKGKRFVLNYSNRCICPMDQVNMEANME